VKIRVNKLPILLPLLLVAVCLVATALTTRLGRDNAADHTDLGQKYLNDMNYDGAIVEFLQSLSMDPTIEDARLGLAEAYIASGNPGMASEILKQLTEAESSEAYRLLVESQWDEDPHQALLTAQKLVEHTDSEDAYRLRDELLARVLAEPHSYAQGLDHQLAVKGGEILSAGSNTLGQLGTTQFMATEMVQSGFQAAQFPGQGMRVYCGGRTSYVVDQDGNLWAAGENRWGQMGLRYSAANHQSGWTQIMDSGDVAAAAGSAGTLYILKANGSLWYAGQGGVIELRQVTGLDAVAAIDSSVRQTAVLTVGGTLYLSDTEEPSRFTRQAGRVKNFCFNSNGLIWVTEENQICSQYSMGQTPDTWIWDGQGVTPDFAVYDIAVDASGLLLLDTSGRLLRVYNGQLYESDGRTVANIYSTGGTVVVEQKDGTAAFWDLSQSDFELIQ